MNEINEDCLIYGRIVGTRIVDYPTYGIHIRNRGHSLEQYVPCYFEEKPEHDRFSYTEEIKKMSTDRKIIFISYIVKPFDIHRLLTNLPNKNKKPFFEYPSQHSIDHNSEMPGLIERIKEIIPVQIQIDLDAFAKTRHYDSLASACSYLYSLNEKYQKEAQYCCCLRDKTWTAFENYIKAIDSGEKIISNRWLDIKTEWPEPSWPI